MRRIGRACRSFTPFHFLFIRHVLRLTHAAYHSMANILPGIIVTIPCPIFRCTIWPLRHWDGGTGSKF